MYIKPTKHIHTDGRRKSLKGVEAGGRGFPPANMSINPVTLIENEKMKIELNKLPSCSALRLPIACPRLPPPPPRGEGEGAQRGQIKQY